MLPCGPAPGLLDRLCMAWAARWSLQEGEDTMLVGGGGAAKTIGALLQRFAEVKGGEAAKEAWAATGERLLAFLPQPDREDESKVSDLVEKFDLQAVCSAC